MSELRSLNVKIRPDQLENLKKLAIRKKKSIGAIVREIFDERLGTADAGDLIFRHINGREEKL